MDRHHPQLGKGSAYIEFERVEDAEKAIRYMDGGQIDGQEITVAKAHGSKANSKTSGSRHSSWRNFGSLRR